MKIAQINTCDYGSTGNLMLQTAALARQSGHRVQTFSRRRKNDPKRRGEHIYFGSALDHNVHNLLAALTGFSECFSVFATVSLVRELKRFDPDVVHLHNLHGRYLNVPILLRYLRKSRVRVIWTLHDCWAFTGQCPHFDSIGCEKWQRQCTRCDQYRFYPRTLFDASRGGYRRKKRWFTSLEDLTLVTPSQWLAAQVRRSFLKDREIRVIPNGIDLDVFRPTDGDFREKYGCADKRMILGVAYGWSDKKGLDVFRTLYARLDPAVYQIVLVGTDEKTERSLPDGIVCIRRTENAAYLAQIYTAADVFVNPSREEVFGLVNAEALACGTPGVVFGSGGNGECYDASCGVVVAREDVDGLQAQIERICERSPFTAADCRRRAAQFDRNLRLTEYGKLYEVANGTGQ